MDQTVVKTAPWFDLDALREETSELARSYSGQDSSLRTALVERLELSDALGEFAVNYSKGMKKKLALICALMHEPPLLILDEPTNGLDPFATRTLHEMVRERAAAGTAVSGVDCAAAPEADTPKLLTVSTITVIRTPGPMFTAWLTGGGRISYPSPTYGRGV